jgi:hypothetical protein
MRTDSSRPGEAITLFTHGPRESRPSRTAMSRTITVKSGPPPARPISESLAGLTRESPTKAGDLPGVLLASTFPVNGYGCEVLRPLWAEEAMHRAYTFMRLIKTRNRRGASADMEPIVAGLEDFVARDLAAQFRDLETGGAREVLPCSTILRDIVTNLGVLFGNAANITLKTTIEPLLLPAYKRRALGLVAAELVSNALLHAFPGHEAGLIHVGLTSLGPKTMCLRVADSGIGFTGLRPNLDCGVAAGLASLLEVDLVYHRISGWTIAEIAFPVSGP